MCGITSFVLLVLTHLSKESVIMSEKKYCFLLPAYKARFFEEALGSILSQTYRDFEVIVSDDCSPEDLKSIVDKFDDPRVSYRRNEKNIGAENLVDHWNMLLTLTDAEYFIMASDDDVYDEHYLEEMDRLSIEYPTANVLRPMVRLIDSNGIETAHECHFESKLDVNRFLELWSVQSLFSGVPYYVFRTVPFKSIGGFPYFPYAWHSDDGAVIQSIIGGSFIAMVDKILFSFRQSDLNITGTMSKKSYEYQVKSALMFDGKYLFDSRISSYIAKMARDREYSIIRAAMEPANNGKKYLLRLLFLHLPNSESRKARRLLISTIIKEHA